MESFDTTTGACTWRELAAEMDRAGFSIITGDSSIIVVPSVRRVPLHLFNSLVSMQDEIRRDFKAPSPGSPEHRRLVGRVREYVETHGRPPACVLAVLNGVAA